MISPRSLRAVPRRRSFFVLSTIAAIFLATVAPTPAATNPTLATDKPDYRPEETVHITGTGYDAGAAYAVPVMRPDATMVRGDGSGLSGWDTVTADGAGNLAYDYILDGMFGLYEARVYAAPWSGNWSETPLATVTFTDGADLDQCANDEPPGNPTCTWQNGDLNGNNSAYAEGDVVPFRLRIEDIAPGTHTIHLNYDFTQGGNKAYDFLATYNATEQVDICGPGGGGQPSSLCPVSPTPDDTAPFPLDPFTSDGIQVLEAQAAFAGPQELSIWGGTITSITVPTHSGDDLTGNSTADMLVTFTTTGDAAILAWGGHIARSVDWNGKGAGQISGAPWHMRTQFLDDSGASNEDRSIQPSALVPGASITVVKDTVPDHVQDFVFQPSTGVNGGLAFILDDDGPDGSPTPNTMTFPVEPGTHTVTESPVDLFDLDSITCEDPTGNSGGNPDTGVATFVVAQGENVTCTFRNVELGRIIVNKVSDEPNTGVDFPFISNFDGDITDGADFAIEIGGSFDSGPLVAGTFAVDEVVPEGWSLVSAECSDGSPINAIVLGTGETVTCTFTNERVPTPYDTYDDDPGDPDFDFDSPFDSTGSDSTAGGGSPTTDVAGTSLAGESSQPTSPSTAGDQLGVAVQSGGADDAGIAGQPDPGSASEAVAPEHQSKLPRTGTAADRATRLGLLLLAAGALALLTGRGSRDGVSA